MHRVLWLIFVLTSAIGSTSQAQAALIQGNNYQHDEHNGMFWSLLDLQLDVARLSWSDTLGLNGQADVTAVNQFVSNNIEGWRWATAAEFVAIHNWFDSDVAVNGWSAEQKAGSALFFLLNGTGPAFTTQQGYDFEGYTYWQFGTLGEAGMDYVWMADFAWQIPGVDCAVYSLLCQSGYFTDENSPLWTAQDVLQYSELNIAPLLVRSSQSFTIASVPANPSAWLLGFGLIALALTRRKA